MTLKRISITSLILMALFFFMGWVFTPAIMQFVTDHMKSVANDLEVINTTTSTQFRIHLLSSLSLAATPIMSFLACLIIIKARKKNISSWDYFFYSSILFVVYFVASVFKYYALEGTITKVLNKPISLDVKNTLPMNQVFLYDWAFYASLFALILIVLIAKRKTKG